MSPPPATQAHAVGRFPGRAVRSQGSSGRAAATLRCSTCIAPGTELQTPYNHDTISAAWRTSSGLCTSTMPRCRASARSDSDIFTRVTDAAQVFGPGPPPAVRLHAHSFSSRIKVRWRVRAHSSSISSSRSALADGAGAGCSLGPDDSRSSSKRVPERAIGSGSGP